MIESKISTLNRLTDYLVYLQIAPEEMTTFNAGWLANESGIGIDYVIKDLRDLYPDNATGIYGTLETVDKLEDYLGFHAANEAIIVGAGRLGRALMEYNGFAEKGLSVVAAFDANKYALDPARHIYHLDKLEEFIKDNSIKIGVITVPAAHAQDVADIMVRAGILGIWCFAPVKLKVPEDVYVQYENMSVGLAALANHVKAQL